MTSIYENNFNYNNHHNFPILKFKNNKIENQNNFYTEETNSKIINNSISNKNHPYQQLLKSYSQTKKDYKKYYSNGKRRNNSPSYLKKIYLKSQKKLSKYFKDNINNEGLKLEGNKSYENISLGNYLNEIETYMEHIENKLNENNLYYLYPNENDNLTERLKLTPIPSKSRILMKTNEEMNELSSAERSAVMLRRVEYTHGFSNNNYKNKITDKLNRKRHQIYMIMKEAVLTIENWWKKILDKRNFNNKSNGINNFNDNLNNRILNLTKIFFKQMENFYYMKKNKKRKKMLFFTFIGKLRALKKKHVKKHKIDSARSTQRDSKFNEFDPVFNNKNNFNYHSYNSNNNNEINNNNDITYNSNFSPKKDKEIEYSNEIRKKIFLKSPKSNNNNIKPLSREESINQLILENGVTMIIGREEKVIKKNKMKLIETSSKYNSGRNNKIKIKNFIYSSPKSIQLKHLFHSPVNNTSQKFKNKFLYSNSIVKNKDKEKEKNIEEKYQFLLEKNKNANKKYNYYPKKNYDYNNEKKEEIKPYTLRNDKILTKNNDYKLYNNDNNLIFRDNKFENINYENNENDEEDNESLSKEQKINDLTNELENEKEEIPNKYPNEKQPYKLDKYNNKKNSNQQNDIINNLNKNDKKSNNSSVMNSLSSNNIPNNKKNKNKNINQEEISKNSEKIIDNILRNRKDNYQDNKKENKKNNKNNLNQIKNNNNKNNNLNDSKNSSNKSLNKSLSMKNSSSNLNQIPNDNNIQKKSINNNNINIKFKNSNDEKENKININKSKDYKNNYNKEPDNNNINKNEIKKKNKEEEKISNKPSIKNQEEMKIINIKKNLNKIKINTSEEDETILNHSIEDTLNKKIKNLQSSDTEQPIEVSDEYGIINSTNKMNKNFKDFDKNNRLINLHIMPKPKYIDDDNVKLTEEENNKNQHLISNNLTNDLNVETGDIEKKNIPNFDELKFKKQEDKKNELIKRNKNENKEKESIKKNSENYEDENYYKNNYNDLKQMNIKASPENISTIRKLLHSYDKGNLNNKSYSNENKNKKIRPKNISQKNLFRNSSNDILNNSGYENKNNISKFSQNKLTLMNSSSFSFLPINNYQYSLSKEEKMEKFIFLILHWQKQEFFSRLVLNYLQKNNIDLNNKELINLLKLGKSNTYQKILNNSLKLNITKNDYDNKNISFKDWVKKFVKNEKDLENKDELKRKYKMFLNITKVIKRDNDEKILEDNQDLLKNLSKSNNNISINKLDNYINNKKNNLKLFKPPKKTNTNSFNMDLNTDLFFYKSFKNNKILNINIRHKRDISNDIIMPKDISDAYNLIKKKEKETNNNEILREFNDYPEKF